MSTEDDTAELEALVNEITGRVVLVDGKGECFTISENDREWLRDTLAVWHNKHHPHQVAGDEGKLRFTLQVLRLRGKIVSPDGDGATGFVDLDDEALDEILSLIAATTKQAAIEAQQYERNAAIAFLNNLVDNDVDHELEAADVVHHFERDYIKPRLNNPEKRDS